MCRCLARAIDVARRDWKITKKFLRDLSTCTVIIDKYTLSEIDRTLTNYETVPRSGETMLLKNRL